MVVLVEHRGRNGNQGQSEGPDQLQCPELETPELVGLSRQWEVRGLGGGVALNPLTLF